MSVLVVGLSHRTSSVDLLERATLDPDACTQLRRTLCRSEHATEAVVLSTCNRIEIYCEVGTFHGGLTTITNALADATGISLEELRDQLYVHFEDRVVAHLFRVAAGLDSIAVGEAQILGQLRTALKDAQDSGSIAGTLDPMLQQALRVGKRVHSETQIDTVSRSLIERALHAAHLDLGPLAEQHAVVVGAGAMSGLTAHTLRRHGIGQLTIVGRTPAKAQRLAEATGGRAAGWDQLAAALSQADLVVSCTGAAGHVIGAAELPQDGRTRVLIDLALPRDIAPELAQRPGTTVLTLTALGEEPSASESGQIQAVDDLVTAQVTEYLMARRAAAIGPTVAALRARAQAVVAAELGLMHQRTELDAEQTAQVDKAVHRIVEKLLHVPTVRMKELAAQEHLNSDLPGLLSTLFDLDPHTEQVAQIPHGGELV